MGGLIKNKGGAVLIQISQKERLSHILWQPSAFGNNLTMSNRPRRFNQKSGDWTLNKMTKHVAFLTKN